MKFYVVIFILWILALGSLPAFASSVTCTYSDRGWEEHWKGHKSCEECLSKHGRCVERCEISFYTCRAEGKDTLGNTLSFIGYGDSNYDGSRNARSLCERHLRSCNYSASCTSTSEVISTKECSK